MKASWRRCWSAAIPGRSNGILVGRQAALHSLGVYNILRVSIMSGESDTEVTLSTAASISERDRLQEFDSYLEQFIAAVREEAEHIDTEQVQRLVETSKRLGLRLEEKLPPTLAPAVSSEIRAILLGGMRQLEQLQGEASIDLLDDFLLRAESIRHIVRDALDEDVSAEVDLTSKAALARWLIRELDGVPRTEVAELVGVDVRTLQRWLGGIGGVVPHRARVVARVIAILRNAWTPSGTVAWFRRERPRLGGAPINFVSDPAREPDLLLEARQGRAQHGS